MKLLVSTFLAIAWMGWLSAANGATSELETLELRAGLNVVGYPVAGSGETTTFALLAQLGNADSIDRVIAYDADNEVFAGAFYDDAGAPAGVNSPVKFGQGVLVVAKTAITINIEEAATCRPLKLTAGFNIFSLPCAAPNLTAFKLLRALGDQAGGVIIERFNGVTARFEAAGSKGNIWGTDFQIVPGEALILHTNHPITNFDVQVAGPEGGVFEFANGLTLTLPSGALDEPTAILLESVECREVEGILNEPAISSFTKSCLRSVRAMPDGLAFAQPGRISFMTQISAPSEIPLVLLLNESADAYQIQSGSIDYAEGLLSAEINHFSTYTYSNNGLKLSISGDDLPPECNTVPTPKGACCTTFTVETNEGDIATGNQCDSCQIVGQNIDILFPSCPGAPRQQIRASESSGDCPADLQLVIDPPEPTLWTCQEQLLTASASGTNANGGRCTFNAPTDWKKVNGNSTLQLTQLPINQSRISATMPGNATIEASSPADPDFKVSILAEFESLSGTWSNTFLSGSEMCVLDGQEITFEDDGPSTVSVNIEHTCTASENNLRITSVDLPQAEAFVGPLVPTQNPNAPFTFDAIGFANSPQSADCQVINVSNGTDIVFGDTPLCDSDGNACEIQSCSESETLQGSVSNAIAGIISGDNTFTLNAAWDELVPQQGGGILRMPHTISCNDQGNIVFQANKVPAP